MWQVFQAAYAHKHPINPCLQDTLEAVIMFEATCLAQHKQHDQWGWRPCTITIYPDRWCEKKPLARIDLDGNGFVSCEVYDFKDLIVYASTTA